MSVSTIPHPTSQWCSFDFFFSCYIYNLKFEAVRYFFSLFYSASAVFSVLLQRFLRLTGKMHLKPHLKSQSHNQKVCFPFSPKSVQNVSLRVVRVAFIAKLRSLYAHHTKMIVFSMFTLELNTALLKNLFRAACVAPRFVVLFSVFFYQCYNPIKTSRYIAHFFSTARQSEHICAFVVTLAMRCKP